MFPNNRMGSKLVSISRAFLKPKFEYTNLNAWVRKKKNLIGAFTFFNILIQISTKLEALGNNQLFARIIWFFFKPSKTSINLVQ